MDDLINQILLADGLTIDILLLIILYKIWVIEKSQKEKSPE